MVLAAVMNLGSKGVSKALNKSQKVIKPDEWAARHNAVSNLQSEPEHNITLWANLMHSESHAEACGFLSSQLVFLSMIRCIHNFGRLLQMTQRPVQLYINYILCTAIFEAGKARPGCLSPPLGGGGGGVTVRLGMLPGLKA